MAKVIVKSSVGLVIRISDGKNIAGSLKGQLRELRLNNKYEAKFVKLDEEALSEYFTYIYCIDLQLLVIHILIHL